MGGLSLPLLLLAVFIAFVSFVFIDGTSCVSRNMLRVASHFSAELTRSYCMRCKKRIKKWSKTRPHQRCDRLTIHLNILAITSATCLPPFCRVGDVEITLYRLSLAMLRVGQPRVIWNIESHGSQSHIHRKIDNALKIF